MVSSNGTEYFISSRFEKKERPVSPLIWVLLIAVFVHYAFKVIYGFWLWEGTSCTKQQLIMMFLLLVIIYLRRILGTHIYFYIIFAAPFCVFSSPPLLLSSSSSSSSEEAAAAAALPLGLSGVNFPPESLSYHNVFLFNIILSPPYATFIISIL
jgi:hypothetical protein